MDCAALTLALRAVDGYSFTMPPAGPDGDWCVLDDAAWRATGPGRPDLTAERFRLKGTADGDRLVSLEVDLSGLRVAFQAGDATVDDRLRGLFRLQSAELRFVAMVVGESGLVTLQGGVLRLSGGTEVIFNATAEAGGLGTASLMAGSLTAAEVTWRNDGRLLRPVMEVLGERLVDGVTGSAAVDAARLSLRQIADNLPDSALTEDARSELGQALDALPQGRGRLVLSFSASEGIGAAQVLMAMLGDDPLGPDGLSALFRGATLDALWMPGLDQ